MKKIVLLISLFILLWSSLAQASGGKLGVEPRVKDMEVSTGEIRIQQDCVMITPTHPMNRFDIGEPFYYQWETDLLNYLSDRYNYWWIVTDRSTFETRVRTCDDLMKTNAMSRLLNNQIADGPFSQRVCGEQTAGRFSWAYPNSAGFNAIGHCDFDFDRYGDVHVIRNTSVYLSEIRCCKLPLGN